VLGILGGALELARGCRGLGARAGGRAVVEAAHGAAETRAEDRARESGSQDGHRGQADLEDPGVARRGPGLGAALLRRRHLQPDRAVKRYFDGVVIRGVRHTPQPDVLEAAFASRRDAQTLSAVGNCKT
jgi:hypothetical protein